MEGSLCSVLQDDPAFQPEPLCDPSFIYIRGYPVQSFLKCKESGTSSGSAQELRFGALSEGPPHGMGRRRLCLSPKPAWPCSREARGIGKEEGKRL